MRKRGEGEKCPYVGIMLIRDQNEDAKFGIAMVVVTIKPK